MFAIRVFLSVVISFFLLNSTWAQPIQKGVSVEQVLRHFQMNGVKVLYSSKLVNADMVVQEEPKSHSARGILNQVLEPHGLKVTSGPADTLLVVPAQHQPSEKPVTKNVSDFVEEVEVPFVTIYITAKDEKNQFLTNLTAKDFILKEDGVEQQITEFSNFSDSDEFPEDTEPLTIMLLLDISASMNDLHAGQRKYDFVRDAALSFIDQIRVNDQVMVMGFNQDPRVISELTDDKVFIREKLVAEPELGGRTALYDMLIYSVNKMQTFPGRRVLVLCSDGIDSASKSKLEDTLKFLQTSDVTVFVIGTDDRRDVTHKGRDVMKKISNATAGYSFLTASDLDLKSSIEKVRLTLRSQYAAGYIPPSPTIHKWRRIKIECKVPRVRLKYRDQYLF